MAKLELADLPLDPSRLSLTATKFATFFKDLVPDGPLETSVAELRGEAPWFWMRRTTWTAWVYELRRRH